MMHEARSSKTTASGALAAPPPLWGLGPTAASQPLTLTGDQSMRRFWASLGSLVFFLIAPGTVLGLVPWWITEWQLRAPFGGNGISRWLGAGLIVLGLMPLIASFARFAWDGLGTPAPIAPPSRLVVTGAYRRVRNPIYIALVVVLSGEALFFADVRVLYWALIFWAGVHLVVVGYEEPVLKEKFGAQYETYRTHVPRWLPRMTPWVSTAP
jgi:protein-S-isoprenylcysteine O-methyltransferase Ste14